MLSCVFVLIPVSDPRWAVGSWQGLEEDGGGQG